MTLQEYNSSKPVEIAKVHSSCRECAYAVFHQDIQTGCLAGALEKFQAQGFAVECFDENEKQFYVINMRQCRWARANLQPLDQVRKEAEISYAAILWWNSGFEDLIYTIKSLVKQSPKPSRITIINAQGLEPRYVDKCIREYMGGIPFNIVYAFETGDRENCLEVAYRDCKLPIFMSFDAGYEVPPDFAHTIDIAVNDKLTHFCMVLPDEDGNGLVGLTLLYSLMGSTEDFRFKDRVLGFTKEANETYLVKKFEEL